MEPTVKTVEIKAGFYPSLLYLAVPAELGKQPFVEAARTVLTTGSVNF
jgi:hypothetical protein